MNEIEVSMADSVTLRRTNAMTTPTTTPKPTPTTTARLKSKATEPIETSPACPPAAAAASGKAAIAVRSDTRAVASLTSDSPSRIVTIRRGSPMRRATAVAATASGGATIAPSANATANGTPSSQ